MTDTITIRGAREHNLRGVDLDLPRGRWIAVCGVSGSGKSSLAFDTLHAEGQRRYLEALGGGLAPGLSALQRPKVDVITGLPPTIALDQRVAAPGSRSTVGTLSDADALLRVILARAGTQHCPTCDRAVVTVAHDEIVADLLTLPDGARLLLEAPVRVRGDAEVVLAEVGRMGFSRVRIGEDVVRLDALEAGHIEAAETFRVVVDRVRVRPDKAARISDAVRTTARAGGGVVVARVGDEERTFTERPWCLHCEEELPPLEPGLLSPFSPLGACPECSGTGCEVCEQTGLREAARCVRWHGDTIVSLSGQSVQALDEALEGRADEVTELALEELRRRLRTLILLGLGQLPLARRGDALSGGEVQRLRVARQVGSALSGVLFVLDEPEAGLSDVGGVVTAIEALREAGNTVLTVVHDATMIQSADRVIEFGPGPGIEGGRVIFEGTSEELLEADTPTGRWLSEREQLEPRPKVSAGDELEGIPLGSGVITALVGASGSGKSTRLDALAEAAEGHFERVIVLEQGPVARSARSIPATYVGAWTVLRRLLGETREAQIRALTARHFSLNVKGGRCEACQGTGERRVRLELLPDVVLECPVCRGARFARDTLEVRWKGHNAAELLALTAQEARELLSGHPKLGAMFRSMVDVGLGYLPLGQPSATLSGGEAHRLKLARELARAARTSGEGVLYLLDDPTLGLHPADVAVLLNTLRRLTEEGASVVLATHDEKLAGVCDVTVRL